MKINIGGEQTKDGWKIFNIQKKPGVDFIGDISDLSQFKDNSVEEIYISHVFEHVPQKKVDKTLKGIFRVLKPGGRFMCLEFSKIDNEILNFLYKFVQLDIPNKMFQYNFSITIWKKK